MNNIDIANAQKGYEVEFEKSPQDFSQAEWIAASDRYYDADAVAEALVNAQDSADTQQFIVAINLLSDSGRNELVRLCTDAAQKQFDEDGTTTSKWTMRLRTAIQDASKMLLKQGMVSYIHTVKFTKKDGKVSATLCKKGNRAAGKVKSKTFKADAEVPKALKEFMDLYEIDADTLLELLAEATA